MATTRLNIDGGIGLPLDTDFTAKTGGSGSKPFANVTRFGLSGGITRYARNFTGKVEQTFTLSGAVQSQSATVAGVVSKTAFRTISGAVTSQSATVSGFVDAFALLSGAVQSQSATVSGTANSYPITGWSLTDFTVDYATLSANSPFSGDVTYSALVSGDKCHYESTTTPDALGVSMAGNGEFTITGTVTVNQTFDFQIYDLSDGTFGTTGTITVEPGVADVTLSGAVSSGSATVSGSLNSFTLNTLSGSVSSQNATVAGTITVGNTVVMSGAVASQSASVSGSLERVIKLSGSIQSQPATVSGSLIRIASFSGAVQSQSATVSGIVSVPTLHVLGPSQQTIVDEAENNIISDDAEKNEFYG